jgi:hypothetical protein
MTLIWWLVGHDWNGRYLCNEIEPHAGPYEYIVSSKESRSQNGSFVIA